jgi:hypothetical protein
LLTGECRFGMHRPPHSAHKREGERDGAASPRLTDASLAGTLALCIEKGCAGFGDPCKSGRSGSRAVHARLFPWSGATGARKRCRSLDAGSPTCRCPAASLATGPGSPQSRSLRHERH